MSISHAKKFIINDCFSPNPFAIFLSYWIEKSSGRTGKDVISVPSSLLRSFARTPSPFALPARRSLGEAWEDSESRITGRRMSRMGKRNKQTYALIILLCLSSLTTLNAAPFTIMLDPAGDAHYAGRVIDDCFERGITLQLMEQLQTVITQRFPNIRAVLTRLPGETREPLQHANFANRLDVDLYISIHCYPESKPKSQLYLYYFSYNDPFASTPAPYAMCPYDKAYLYSIQTTKKWSDMIARTLNSGQFASLFIFHGNYALPFSPLIGIKKPAIAFEIGLKQKDGWKQFIEPIIASLTPIFESQV